MHSEGDPNCQCMDCFGGPCVDESVGEGLYDVMETER